MRLNTVFFDLVRADEVPAAHAIETEAFPPDEAASLAAFHARQAAAPALFLGAFLPPRTLVGYANATRAAAPTLTAASMHAHDPLGTSVCVHAVAVAAAHRRQGVARSLLAEYVRRLEAAPDIDSARVERVLLLAHADLVPLYTAAGFELLGPSPVVHGPQPWLELRKELSPPADVPPDVLAALLRGPRARPTGRLFASFPSTDALAAPDGTNAFDILCPRPGCGSLVLKASAATLETRPSRELEPPAHAAALLPPLPAPPAPTTWWRIAPSEMAFENIAFSRGVPGAPQTKLLACAECELGPLGWCAVGASEFWLVVSRVAYR